VKMDLHFRDRQGVLLSLARENIVPVKAPPWARYPFELRRNGKTKKGDIGRLISPGAADLILKEKLGVRDDESCREVRELIKRLRKSYGYK